MRTLSTRLAGAFVLALSIGPAIASDADLRVEAIALFGRVDAPSSDAAASPEAELGRALFWDERLSSDGRTSCASCHPASDWSADRRRHPIDARGEPTSRHSPPIFNSLVDQVALRWLGDRRDGAAQAESSLTGSLGFSSKAAAVEALERHGYRDRFSAVFQNDAQPLSARNFGKALAAYQATLTTPAPFDRFLAGDDNALDAGQKAGLRHFVEIGCAGCHSGPLFGGTSYHLFGIVKEYWRETGSDTIDVGRVALTKNEDDRYVFRVPMLRNVAKTAPYFHDGSIERLDRAVRIMASIQLDRTLADEETTSIVRFLEALTGEIPAHYAPPLKDQEPTNR